MLALLSFISTSVIEPEDDRQAFMGFISNIYFILEKKNHKVIATSPGNDTVLNAVVVPRQFDYTEERKWNLGLFSLSSVSAEH